MPITHSLVVTIPDDAPPENAGEVQPSHWNADHVVVGGTGDGIREQLTVDTTYNVPGDFATIQEAVDHVMYNVTGRGINVTIQVADGTYAENITLGPHQIFALGSTSYYSAPRINFSDVSTPRNILIAPTTPGPTWAGTEGACISVNNSLWQLSGGVSIAIGSSGNFYPLAAFNNGHMRIGGPGAAALPGHAYIVFTDAVPSAVFSIEMDSSIIVGDRAVQFESDSTLGSLVIVDANAHFEAYQSVDFQFNIDPGFVNSTTTTPCGMWGAQFSGGCSIISRMTYSGSGAAAPALSYIDFGNHVIDINQYMPFTAISLVDNASHYNGASRTEITGNYGDLFALDGSTGTFQATVQSQWALLGLSAGGSGANSNAAFAVARTRGADPATPSSLINGDSIGGFSAYGSDGSAYVPTASWGFIVDGAVGANSVPTAFIVFTGDANYGLEALRLTSAQHTIIPATSVIGWGTGGVLNAGLSEISANVVGLGNGTQGDTSGTLQVANVHSNVDLSMSATNSGNTIDLSFHPASGGTPIDFTMPSTAIFRVAEFPVFSGGAGDLLFQGFSAGGGGYTVLEDVSGLGTIIGTALTASPVIIAVNRANTAQFDAPGSLTLTPTTIAGLPTPTLGMMGVITDGDAALAWGATAVNSGAGATKYFVWYNGANWTVWGK